MYKAELLEKQRVLDEVGNGQKDELDQKCTFARAIYNYQAQDEHELGLQGMVRQYLFTFLSYSTKFPDYHILRFLHDFV